jgi:hypothetical protein
MPTREVLASFWRDWDRLTPQQQRAFRAAVAQFIADLSRSEQGFHPRLHVKRVQGHPGVWEMTWAYDGRATFQHGPEVNPGQPTSSGGGSAPTASFADRSRGRLHGRTPSLDGSGAGGRLRSIGPAVETVGT